MSSGNQKDLDRRGFLKLSAAAAAMSAAGARAEAQQQGGQPIVVDDFDRPDSPYHGDNWESLNPGYWSLKNKALRRRLKNVGDRARATGFPYHYETHNRNGGVMPVEYDPTLPDGMILRRDWKLSGNYAVAIDATIRGLRPKPRAGDDPKWKMYQAGYGLMGLCIGSQHLLESFGMGGRNGAAAWYAAWSDDNQFGLYDHANDRPAAKTATVKAPSFKAGDKVHIRIEVSGSNRRAATVAATLAAGDKTWTVTADNVDRAKFTEGYIGLIARGLLDFEVNRITLEPDDNTQLSAPINDCQVCYALGHTLQKVDDQWRVRFIGIFRNDGKRAEIRIADSPNPGAGWSSVSVAGSGAIINNDFRLNTAIIDAVLPANPADKTLYYTVWKDGRDVTADPRFGTDAVGVGTGMIGKVPASGNYVGRLPRLAAPYRLCGLSCHAISGGNPNLPESNRGQGFFVHDQPTPDAYAHLEAFDFQVMLWEDDVWYLELLLYPPSTDDAYKIITTTLCGPTARWQMMRHWNIINPGDHDHGMDDVHGPEQIVIRKLDDLGQDPTYMRRNFQIVSHLSRGEEKPSGVDNPKRWARWKMPAGDFTLLIMDSRLWRSSQDTKIWDDEGWGHKEGVYSRTDPTRSLLGEEQFAWLEKIIRTDSSPLVCLTGINGLHTVWTGGGRYSNTQKQFKERDRVAADYAGWVAAASDRVIELLASRSGVVTVYGDVHNGCIMRNIHHRLYECSFGPVGRTGGRATIDGFGRRMTDIDGRDLRVFALYHREFTTPQLKPNDGPTYWNFMEMHFDPRGMDPQFALKIRNLIDAPPDQPRGGGFVDDRASNTGRAPTCTLPPITTLPNADVRLATADGAPIRATRSLDDGTVPLPGLADVPPGVSIIVTATDGASAEAKVVVTLPV